ncbi:hypothetical protein GCM10011404_30700 [Sphingomonas prati]|nr:hypothetical protein GCM10011404_30700 [Sphingomonas prati]
MRAVPILGGVIQEMDKSLYVPIQAKALSGFTGRIARVKPFSIEYNAIDWPITLFSPERKGKVVWNTRATPEYSMEYGRVRRCALQPSLVVGKKGHEALYRG